MDKIKSINLRLEFTPVQFSNADKHAAELRSLVENYIEVESDKLTIKRLSRVAQRLAAVVNYTADTSHPQALVDYRLKNEIRHSLTRLKTILAL